MQDYCDSWQNQSEVMKEIFNEYIENKWYLTLEPDGSTSLMEQAIPFGKSENGDFLLGDINSGVDEFDIYITNFKGIGVIRIAKDLDEFIYKITHDLNMT